MMIPFTNMLSALCYTEFSLLCLISLWYCLSFTSFSLGLHYDVDLSFSDILVRKVNVALDKTTWATCLYHHIINPYMTDGVTVMPFSANLLQKVSVAMDHLCQIALNQKLPSKFQKWCKLSTHVKQNWAKRNQRKQNLPVSPDDSPFWPKCVGSKISHTHNKSS